MILVTGATGPFAGATAAFLMSGYPADIGAVAANALTDPRHAGQTYRLTGPEATTRRETAWPRPCRRARARVHLTRG
jgi:uncharacterized protein YbjT (DUF2867 family)